MNWQERIVLEPNILMGKPIIKGTRLSVEFIIDLLAQGWSTEDILDNYSGITIEDIRACLSYANPSCYPLECQRLKSWLVLQSPRRRTSHSERRFLTAGVMVSNLGYYTHRKDYRGDRIPQ